MLSWIRIWIFVLIAASTLPVCAQEWIYCPAAPEELVRQCRQTENAIRRNQELIATVGDQMRNPEIILARVERRPGESVTLYQARVKQQQGVATSASNRWLPIRGRYFDPDREIMYVALDRQAYWQYIWEALASDGDLARRTFADRERLSRQFKEARFLGPDGQLMQWQREIDAAQHFRQQCCRTLPAAEAPSGPPHPGTLPAL
jgi:hypothetical protein